MVTTDAQVRKLMDELSRHGKVGQAAMRAGMHRNTARKYKESGKLPSELRKPRTWRTREDPFSEDWSEVEERLRAAPELEAKALFEDLVERHPGKYEEGQLRTFQRRVRQWRASDGPPKEVYFPQEHRAGEAMQTDFTHCGCLEITIEGEHFGHMLCHAVLPYSNWSWATVCQSESMAALRRGVQEAVYRLGRVPKYHQTDNSTAATHDLRNGKRDFNEGYKALMRHLGMEPRTIAVGESHQNGDVESLNGALKRRLTQHLLLRGSREFASVEAYESWVGGVLEKANGLRVKRTKEDLESMRPLQVKRLPEYSEEKPLVTTWSTIKVRKCIYSVPSRLIGERVTVRVYDDRIEVYYSGGHQLTTERLHGTGRHRVDYRHLVWSLIRKPGAFRRYRYREDLYPSLVFRRAYDELGKLYSDRKADLEYIRILHLAASTMESEVEAALQLLQDEQQPPYADSVKALVAPRQVEVPDLPAPEVELSEYDQLLEHREVAV